MMMQVFYLVYYLLSFSNRKSSIFLYAHKRQRDVFIQEGTIALEFYCSIICFLEDVFRGKLKTIESHGIGIQVLKNIIVGNFVCCGTVMTTTLANHTGIDANTYFGNSKKPCGHGLGIFGTGQFINSSSEVENVDAIAVNVNTGIRNLSEIVIMPFVIFMCTKTLRIDDEIVFNYAICNRKHV